MCITEIIEKLINKNSLAFPFFNPQTSVETNLSPALEQFHIKLVQVNSVVGLKHTCKPLPNIVSAIQNDRYRWPLPI